MNETASTSVSKKQSVRGSTKDDGHVRYTTVHLTEQCNLACSYCFGQGHLSDRHMSEQTALEFAEWFTGQARSGSYAVTFFGGEPFLRFPLMELIIETIGKLKKEGTDFSFSATSNGTLIDASHLDVLKKYKLHVMLSTDGDRETHDRFRVDRQGNGSFEQFLKGYAHLKSVQPKVTARLTFSPETVGKLTCNHEALLIRHNFSTVAATPVTEDQWDKESLETLQQELYDLAALLVDEWKKGRLLRIRILEKGIQEILECPHDKKIKYPCGAGRAAAGVGVDGNIYPCHRFVGVEEFVVGTLQEGVDVARRASFLLDPFSENKLYDSHCESCESREFCRNECYQVCYETTGDIHSPPTSFCQIKKKIHEVSLKLLKYLFENDKPLLAAMTGIASEDAEKILQEC